MQNWGYVQRFPPCSRTSMWRVEHERFSNVWNLNLARADEGKHLCAAAHCVLVIPVTPPQIVIVRLAPTLSHLLALCPSMFLLFLLHLLILIWDSLLPNNKSLHFSCYTSPHWMWDSRPSCYTFLHSLALVIPSTPPHRPAPTHRYQTYFGFPSWFTVENHLVTGNP